MYRTCPKCGAKCNGARGLVRHVQACDIRKIRRWKYHPHEALQRFEDSDPADHYREEVKIFGDVSSAEERRSDNIDQNAYPESEELLSTHGVALESVDAGRTPDMDRMASSEYPSRKPPSSSTVTVIEGYRDVEGGYLPAGHGVHHHDQSQSLYLANTATLPLLKQLPSIRTDKLPPSTFYPFQTSFEWGFSEWLINNHVSAAAMQDVFHANEEIPAWSQVCTIKSVKAFHRVVETIPYGIPGDGVVERTITMPGTDTGRSLEYTVRFRSVISIIRFLIGHLAFKANLSYAPVRLFKDSEKTQLIWNEMHTGSWWWDQQKSLPVGATLVPVLIASDKTQMTQHHGDKSSHPVYITIGNLDKATRRSQSRPSKVLLGFLPIVPRRDHKLTGYHSYEYTRYIHNQAMKIMLQGLSTPIRPSLASGDSV
jgi:hypothetical protein